MRRLGAAGIVGTIVILFAAGCGDAKDLQIQSLQRENDGLRNENEDLKSRLASCTRDADDARRRALQLQGINDDLRNQLAAAKMQAQERPDTVNRFGDFIDVEGFAWANVEGDILFDSGKAVLKSEGKAKLRDIVSQIQQRYAGRDILIIGHTDNDPIRYSAKDWKDNLDLSLGRGRVVALEVIALGLDPTRVIAAGQGEWSPRAANDKANKKLNRRVEFIAVQRPAESRGAATLPQPG